MSKRGRKKRERTTAEKLVMKEVRDQLLSKLEGWTVEGAAEDLKVSRATLYNYRKEISDNTPVPTYEILRRMHERWGFKFQYIDFGHPRRPSISLDKQQTKFEFLEGVDPSNIEVTSAKPMGRDTLELVVHIRFAS